MVSSKKKVLSAFLSLAMIGSMVAAVPLTASADTTTATPVVTYSVHQQSYGWESTVTGPATAGVTGQSKRLEALKINAPSGATISYSVHQQSYGWEAAVSNGATAGITGKSKRLEAVKISLSGLPGYTIQYRVHQQSYGWENWVSNGVVAGVTGQSKRLEAIEIKLVPTVATVSAVNGTIGVGGSTTFTFKSADGTAYTPKTAIYSLEDASFGSIDSSTGKFTAGKAGKAVVDVVADGASLKATVNIYGAATALQVTPAATSVVANNTTTDALTVTAVDANGIPVLNYNGTAGIAIDQGFTITTAVNGQASDVTGSNVTLTNGVGTVLVTSGNIPGITGKVTLTSNGTTNVIKDAASTPVSASVSLNTIAQVATAISVKANYKNVSANANATTTGAFTVQVNDQNGAAMLGGTYPLTETLTGGASLAAGATPTVTGTIVVSAGAPQNVDLYTYQGVMGTYTLAVSGTGLAGGNASIAAAVAGNAAKLSISNDTPTFAQGAVAGTTFTLGATDANGVIVAYPNTATPEVFITDAKGNAFTNATINGSVTAGTDNGYTLPANTSSIVITDSHASADAGTYTVVVKDIETTGTLASVTSTFTITPAAVYKVSVTAASGVLLGTNPTTTINAQATDTYGNAVAAPAGAAVSLSVAQTTGTATLGSKILTFDATGKASTTVTAQDYDGAVVTVTPTTTSFTDATPLSAITLHVLDHPVASFSFALKDTAATGSYSGSTVYAGAGDTVATSVALLASAKDAGGNAANGAYDTVTLIVSHASGLAGLPAGGTYNATTDTETYTDTLANISTAFATASLTAAKAGTVSFTLADSVTKASFAASIQVVAGTTATQIVIPTFASATTIDASKVTSFTVQLADAGGNAVLATADTTVTLAVKTGFTTKAPVFEDANNLVTTTVIIKKGTSSATVFIAPAGADSGTISATAGSISGTSATITAK